MAGPSPLSLPTLVQTSKTATSFQNILLSERYSVNFEIKDMLKKKERKREKIIGVFYWIFNPPWSFSLTCFVSFYTLPLFRVFFLESL
jgi:hypothetical protein